MITLLIDTSSKDVSIAIYNNHKILSSITKSIPNEHSVYTVSFIETVLKEAKLTPKEIEKIMVVAGPGSFTGLRIGVTIAKVYAYLQNIEIIPEQFIKKEKVLEIIKKYKPIIISDEKGSINDISYPKQELNLLKIIEYYQNNPSLNPHLVNPNYLKLPQALEEKND